MLISKVSMNFSVPLDFLCFCTPDSSPDSDCFYSTFRINDFPQIQQCWFASRLLENTIAFQSRLKFCFIWCDLWEVFIYAQAMPPCHLNTFVHSIPILGYNCGLGCALCCGFPLQENYHCNCEIWKEDNEWTWSLLYRNVWEQRSRSRWGLLRCPNPSMSRSRLDRCPKKLRDIWIK